MGIRVEGVRRPGFRDRGLVIGVQGLIRVSGLEFREGLIGVLQSPVGAPERVEVMLA